jgi:alginate O-acetyltransferase complex protein AlgI
VLAFYGQIYFDFAGYSFIAIGIGKTFSFQLPENFNVPYAAAFVTEFCKRWHISLSTWLRHYLFIPLGGNRSHYFRILMLTMVLGGLWHGASWNFVIWGVLHGLTLCIHKWWMWSNKQLHPRSVSFLATATSWFVTQWFILVSWVPFRAPDFATTLSFFPVDTGQGARWAPGTVITWPWLILPLLLDALLHLRVATDMPSTAVLSQREWVTSLLVVILFILIFALGIWDSNAFIYFQF